MGWTSYYREPGQSDRAHFEAELMGTRYSITECASVASVFYALCEPTKQAEDDLKPFALIVMMKRYRGDSDNFCRKEMDESSGPGDTRCPKRVLDAIERVIPVAPNDYAANWRAECRAAIDKRQEAKAVRPGCWIRLEHPINFTDKVERDLFEFIGRNAFRAADGTRVHISNWRLRSYEVIAAP